MAKRFESGPSIPDYKETKKQINKEGYEGEAAVLIGKKEEMGELREKLETEGRTEDLGSFIRLHKETVLPKEEVSPEIGRNVRELLEKNIGRIVEEHIDGPFFYIRYIDKDASVAQVFIDPQKIAEFEGSKIGQLETNKILTEKLNSLGFSNYARAAVKESEEVQGLSNIISNQVREYKHRLEKKARERSKRKV